MTHYNSDSVKPKRRSIGLVILAAIGLFIGIFFTLALFYKKNIRLYLADKLSPQNITLNTEIGYKTEAKIFFKFRNGLMPGFIDSVQYLIKIDADTIGEGVKILQDDKASKDSIFVLKLGIDQKRYLSRIRNSKGENAKLLLRAKIFMMGKMLTGYPITIDKEADLALPIQPELKLEKVEFLKIGLKKSQMIIYILLKNHNKYRAEIKSMDYTLKVKDYMKAEGQSMQSFWINPKQTTASAISVDIDLFHFSKLIKTIWKNETKMPFKLDIKLRLNLVDSPMETLTLTNSILGEIDIKKIIQNRNKEKKD